MATGSLMTTTSPNGSRVSTTVRSKCPLLHASIGLFHSVLKNESGPNGSACGTGAGGRKKPFSCKSKLPKLSQRERPLIFAMPLPNEFSPARRQGQPWQQVLVWLAGLGGL